MNWPTIIAALIIAAIFVAIIIGEVKRRKSGKGGCGCGCSGCAFKENCHSKEK